MQLQPTPVFTHVLLVVVEADSTVHRKLPCALSELVHLLIQVSSLTLTLLEDRLNVSICTGQSSSRGRTGCQDIKPMLSGIPPTAAAARQAAQCGLLMVLCNCGPEWPTQPTGTQESNKPIALLQQRCLPVPTCDVCCLTAEHQLGTIAHHAQQVILVHLQQETQADTLAHYPC